MMPRMGASELLDRHTGIELLSLDFFDTLVTRRLAQPTHVFAEMERQLLQEHGHRWAGFALARVKAEQRARHLAAADDRYRDVTLDEIMLQLADAWSLADTETANLAAMERRIEIELVRAVPFGVELVAEAQRRGLSIMVVSDNYMPSHHLADMAAAAGYVGLDATRIMVSCEHGGMKHNGRLFRELLDATGMAARAILHVGDDPDADGRQPSRLGMATHLDGRMRVSHRHMMNTTPAVLALSRLEADLRDEMYEEGWDTARAIGAGGLAIIVAAQVADAMTVVRSRPVAGVHFAARDGWLAHQVWSRACEGRVDVPGRYLAFSRSVFGRANLTVVDEQVATRFIDDHERLSPRELGRRFDCSITTRLDPDVAVEATVARQLLIDNAGQVLAASGALREKVLGYLGSVGLLEPGHHVVCDAGWTGATVADLAELVGRATNGRTTIEGRFLGLYWEGTTNRTRVAMTGLAIDDLGTLDDNVRLLGAIRYFETLLSAPDGSLVDFADAGSQYAPVMSRNGVESAQYDAVLAPMAAHVIDAATALVERRHRSGVSIDDIDQRTVWATMMQLAHTPRPDEIELLGRLRHVASVDHRDHGRPLVASAPRFSSTLPIDRYAGLYDEVMKRHWLQGSIRAWEHHDSSRVLAHGMIGLWPHLDGCWIDEPMEAR